MYVRAEASKYCCRKCKNKIPVTDLEAIFQEELEVFFTSPEKIASHLSTANKTLAGKEELLAAQERSIQKVRDEMARTHRLFVDGHITGQGFGEFYKPAEQQLNQLVKELPRLQSEVEYLKINHLASTRRSKTQPPNPICSSGELPVPRLRMRVCGMTTLIYLIQQLPPASLRRSRINPHLNM